MKAKINKWVLVFTIAVVVLMWEPLKLVTCVGGFVLIAVCIVAMISKLLNTIIVYWIGVAVWVFCLLLPADLYFRRGGEFNVRYVKVIMSHMTLGAVREAIAKGEVENRDFIYIDCDRWPLVPPKAGLLFIVP